MRLGSPLGVLVCNVVEVFFMSKLSGFFGCVHDGSGRHFGVALCCSFFLCDVTMSITSCGFVWIVLICGFIRVVTLGVSLVLS
jgi:hypothetical protein